MSWLRNNPLRTSFSKQWSRDSPPKDADPSACYDSFCKHWQQTYDIILHSLPPAGLPSQDDVLGVVNHIDQMVTLLMLELRGLKSHNHYRQEGTATHSPCLEHLLSENLLIKLYEWSIHTGRFNDAVRLEQIKLYELLVSHSGTLLAHEPVTRPLLLLLQECANDIMLPKVEKNLVVLLNQLCIALMQNMALLDLFFHPNASGKNKFIIFNLLIPHVHREDGVGQQARDAMLLCMSLSKKNDEVGLYIADQSNICPVLATGLSGLYSLLPRKLDIETDDWHQLTPDDVNDLSALTQLMNSLEFCNAVTQVAHPMVQKQLLEFLYQGFLVPVMGAALLQTTVEELVSATAYFDLFLRSVTNPGLLRLFVRFLLEDNYDECRILDSLIQRISSRSRLCIITLALFETLVNLNCEDVMLELCLGALNPCSHVMLSQRSRLKDVDPFGRAAEKFLSLTPRCCSIVTTPDLHTNSLPATTTYDKSGNTTSNSMKSLPASISYGSKLSDSLYGNYHAYLCDARQKIRACRVACSNWSCQYDGDLPANNNNTPATSGYQSSKKSKEESETISPLLEVTTTTTTETRNLCEYKENSPMANILLNVQSLISEGRDFNSNEPSIKNELNANLSEMFHNEDLEMAELEKEAYFNGREASDCVNESTSVSLRDSSGYESFTLREPIELRLNDEESEDLVNENKRVSIRREPDVLHVAYDVHVEPDSPTTISVLSSSKSIKEVSRQNVFNGQPNVGIFLDVVLRKLECMTSNNLYVNLHLTGLISRLAIYPQPLLQSFLLNHSLVFQPSIRSLFQVLASLKHKIDNFLSKYNNVELLVEQARSFLINREDKLVNARKNVLDATAQSSSVKKHSLPGESLIKAELTMKSLTSSISQIFRRPSNSILGPRSLNALSQPPSISETQFETDRPEYNRYKRNKSLWESPNEASAVQNVVLCAVILDEWLKELAAITQEHAIIFLTDDIRGRV